jgi:hypothetical protein
VFDDCPVEIYSDSHDNYLLIEVSFLFP